MTRIVIPNAIFLFRFVMDWVQIIIKFHELWLITEFSCLQTIVLSEMEEDIENETENLVAQQPKYY